MCAERSTLNRILNHKFLKLSFMSEKDRGNLSAILDSCRKIQEFVEDIFDADAFYADIKTFDAVLMNFVIIGNLL